MNSRAAMLGMSRLTEKGRIYRTLQRFFEKIICGHNGIDY
jgi:hypothetical protein